MTILAPQSGTPVLMVTSGILSPDIFYL